jgi:FtsP/CotA-like multicopper oxidase with cupredoxin domain
MLLNRREFLATAGCGLLASAIPGITTAATPGLAVQLRCAPDRMQIGPDGYPATPIWAFNGTTPGPELRFRQGATARIQVENRIAEETTVHWHGLRLPNAMDGVAHVTQPPIASGGTFDYSFPLPDAGTYWYHPHHAGHEQVARGLYGVMIVEEAEPIEIDRDVTWVLSDWRLDGEAAQIDDFGNMHDMTHAGRIGNAVALNGVYADPEAQFSVRSGERLRLRLVNAATARVFALRFNGHAPRVIAIDGHPVTPFEAPTGQVTLAPGQRADLVLDCIHEPGAAFAVADDYYPRRPFDLVRIVYADETPLRETISRAPVALAPNPVAEPDLARATRHDVVFAGGAMGGLSSAQLDGVDTDLRTLVREHGLAWAINGVASGHEHHPRLLDLPLGSHVVLALRNESAWDHPIHLHGHTFRVLKRNGEAVPQTPWRDTVLLRREETAEIAFVADNPGEWMFHCHVLDHQRGGMMATVRVG